MESNIKEVLDEVLELKTNVVKSIYRAKNKAITRVKTESRRMIQEKYNVKAKDVSKVIKLKKASLNDLNANISFKSSTTPIVFPMLRSRNLPLGKRKGRTVKFKEQRIKVLIKKGSYKNLGGGKHKPFLMRVNASKIIVARRKGKERYTTSQIKTVPVSKMVDNKNISNKILKLSKETYYKEFNRLMELGDV